jgi:diguanylate cyclase (GGDEF)-like protein
MERELSIVYVEDVATEVELAAHHLQRAGMRFRTVRVETEPAFLSALRTEKPDLILSDFSLPQFDGMTALRLARIEAPDTPFIFVSGTIGEERAIEALKLGATDYVLKTNLARLAPAVLRALQEAEEHRGKLQAEQKLRDLVRIHEMLSNINSVVLRSRDRRELLQEAARIAAEKGGYGLACVFLVDAGKASVRPFVWRGTFSDSMSTPSLVLSADSVGGQSITARAIRANQPVVCNDVLAESQAIHPSDRELLQVFRAVVALPLTVDATAFGTLNLYSAQAGAFTEDELSLLRQVVGNISFALQYLHKEDEVQFLAYFDPLTSLAQRGLFSERLARMLSIMKDEAQSFTIMVFDIERLSAINDRYGRHVGDRLLQLIADRLRGLIADTSFLAHFGGGRFGVIFDEAVDSEEAAFRRREDIARLFERPFLIEEQEVRAAARLGTARFPSDGATAEKLLQNAELALKSAKESGEKYLHYMSDMNADALQRLTLEHKLRQALEERQFLLYYQPKVATDTGRIVGVEALIRWQDPEAGLVAPGQFIPVLEASGLIVEVGKWVIEQAIVDGANWRRNGSGLLPIAVNVSNLQLRKKDFVDTVLRILQSAGQVPIDIEITESALMEDLAGAMKKLSRLKEAGVSIAIDDFGTGYSSLGQLSKLAVDTLKIDRSFIVGLSSDPANMTIVSTVISLARSFDLNVVAEGVETLEQLNLLRLLKCHQLQGYLIAKPMPAADFGKLLAQNAGIIKVQGT